MTSRSFSELITFETFEERYQYLKLGGGVGLATFGFDRYLNQGFYTSSEWRRVRRLVILRDNGCDLGIPDRPIPDKVVIHHLNPIVADDIVHGEEYLLDLENLITTTHNTHNAIHYGVDELLPKVVTERLPGDTKLW